MVEDIGGHGGQIDRDRAFTDAALLIENYVDRHQRAFPYASPAARGTSDATAAVYGGARELSPSTRAGPSAFLPESGPGQTGQSGAADGLAW
ncbi:hypothetical protein LRC484719_27690 [Mycobacterium riyadhense]